MGITLLQQKIENLQSLADSLLHVGDKGGYIYADDLSLLNKEIHERMNELFSQKGKTSEQEAALCLAILTGYSVSMYANPEDEAKKQTILNRSRKLLNLISPSPLQQQLLAIYNEMHELCEIN